MFDARNALTGNRASKILRSKLDQKYKCDDGESNPGLNVGNVLFYHLTTIAYKYQF